MSLELQKETLPDDLTFVNKLKSISIDEFILKWTDYQLDQAPFSQLLGVQGVMHPI